MAMYCCCCYYYNNAVVCTRCVCAPEIFACFNQPGAVMATQIRPLGNSFCNYADDTLGGHFEINADDQIVACRVREGVATPTTRRVRMYRAPCRSVRRPQRLIQLRLDKWNSAIVILLFATVVANATDVFLVLGRWIRVQSSAKVRNFSRVYW